MLQQQEERNVMEADRYIQQYDILMIIDGASAGIARAVGYTSQCYQLLLCLQQIHHFNKKRVDLFSSDSTDTNSAGLIELN